jgi:8-oxo-dGTP pyrophosphatase MutT (NUDIX family)
MRTLDPPSEHRCLNCGYTDHTYRHCPHPLTSYGILLFRVHQQAVEYLMICRRHTFGYVEMVRVNFDLRDEAYVRQLLGEMTVTERTKLRTHPFRELWADLWQNTHSQPRYQHEFLRAQKRFDQLRRSALFRRLDTIIRSEWTSPEWGFPKGKRNRNESALACAYREMHEETGIGTDAYVVGEWSNKNGGGNGEALSGDVADDGPTTGPVTGPVVEMFLGTDGRKYRHVYFVGEAHADHPTVHKPRVDESNVLQTREVSDVQWLDYAGCVANIRSYNAAKLALLARVHPLVCAYVACRQEGPATVVAPVVLPVAPTIFNTA